MTVVGWLYSILGLSGLATILFVVRSIKDWGSAEHQKEVAQNEAKQSAEISKAAVKVAQKWADSRVVPAFVRLRKLAASKPKHNP